MKCVRVRVMCVNALVHVNEVRVLLSFYTF